MLKKNWEFILVIIFAIIFIPIGTIYVGVLGAIFSIIATLMMSYIAFVQYELRQSENLKK